MKLDPDQMREFLDYSPDTGIFTWKLANSNRVTANEIAGSICKDGYILIGINGTQYRAHRLAWLWMTGSMPKEIDHINGNRVDNRFINLRKVRRQQNCWNSNVRKDSRTKRKGVTFHPATGKWRARIRINGTAFHLGLFSTIDDASEAYEGAARLLHGEFTSYIFER